MFAKARALRLTSSIMTALGAIRPEFFHCSRRDAGVRRSSTDRETEKRNEGQKAVSAGNGSALMKRRLLRSERLNFDAELEMWTRIAAPPPVHVPPRL